MERELTCLVGGQKYYGNQYEHLACRLKKGTPVRFTRFMPLGGPKHGTGVFDFTWFYDGVAAKIDDGTEGGVRLSLDCGDTIEVIEDAAEIRVPSVWPVTVL